MTEKLKKNLKSSILEQMPTANWYSSEFKVFQAFSQPKVRVRTSSQFRHKQSLQSRIHDTQSNNQDATVTQSQPLVLSSFESRISWSL